MMKTLAAATLTAAMLVSPAAAQNAAGPVVAQQLDAVTSEMGLAAGARVTGRLAAGRSETATIQSVGGPTWFIGVCDGNCTDLDLIVRDASGREVGRDEEIDDVPLVAAVTTAGTFTVEVSMADCRGECDWGVGVFRR